MVRSSGRSVITTTPTGVGTTTAAKYSPSAARVRPGGSWSSSGRVPTGWSPTAFCRPGLLVPQQAAG